MMKIAGSSILLTALLMCLLPGYTYASTSSVFSGLSSRTVLSQPRDEHSNLLFAQQTEDSMKVHTSESMKLKDPNVALFRAAVPGFFVHGAGHFYAGRRTTGIVLLACELVGCTFFTVGALDQAVSQLEGAHSSDGVSGEGLIVIGAILFVGSWTYDMIGAPLAVRKYNAALIEKKPVGMELRMREGQPRLVVVWRF